LQGDENLMIAFSYVQRSGGGTASRRYAPFLLGARNPLAPPGFRRCAERGCAAGVGESTKNAVVLSSILILFFNVVINLVLM
jgi:hypothetical protein